MIRYREGYKYQLSEGAVIQTSLRPKEFIKTPWIRLDVDGVMSLTEGYAWDGSTGVEDTKESMEASAMHDAAYQLLRAGLLPPADRDVADLDYQRICIEKGMWKVRAWWRHTGLKRLAAFAAETASESHIIEIP